MPTVYVLSENDREAIRKAVLDSLRAKNLRSRPPETHVDHEEFPAPEVYVAKTPTGGIPALIESYDPGTGSNESGDTGTGTAAEPDTIGYADCEIYRLLTNRDTDDDQLIRVGKLKHRIYNLGTIPVLANAWILVSRDKFGTWFVAFPPSTVAFVMVTDPRWVSGGTYYTGAVVAHNSSTYKANVGVTNTGTGTAGVLPGVDWDLVAPKLRGRLYDDDLVLQPEHIWVREVNGIGLDTGYMYMAARGSDYRGLGQYLVSAREVVTSVACVGGSIVYTTKFV